MLTPHEGELGRLLDRPADEIARHRLASAREAAERSGAVVLLKGDDTIVALPGGEVAVNPGGSPALATAGTGDVLSGLIGALLAKRLDGFAAACLGALAHVLAARCRGRAGRRRPRDGRRRDRRAALRPDAPIVSPPAWPARYATSWTRPRDGAPRHAGRGGRARCCASTSCPGVPVVDDDGALRRHRDRGRPGAARRPGRPAPPALHQPVRRHGLPRAAGSLRAAAAQGVRLHGRGHDEPRSRHGRPGHERRARRRA